MNDETSTKIAKLEDKINPETLGQVITSQELGGVQLANIQQVVEFAKMMAVSNGAVPLHLRGQHGTCFAICMYAMEWGMSPFAVANKSYVVNDRLSFESQLIHALLETRAPLQQRIRHTYAGEGDERTCTVIAFLKGEQDPIQHTSPPIGKILPKNSPLWKTKPDVQLYYNTIRDFGRIYFPDLILGIYSKDELEDAGPMGDPKPASPNLIERLGERVGQVDIPTEGFHPSHAENGINGTADDGKTIEHEAGADQTDKEPEAEKEVETTKPRTAGRGKGAGKTTQADTIAKAETTPAKPAGKAKAPTNFKEYQTHLKAWLAEATEGSDISERFKSERKIRNACGMVSDETIECRAIVNARIEEL